MKNLIKTKAKKGFSLVELLVVIAVIGIIAAIAIPAMSGIFGEATTTKSKRNAQNIAGAIAAAQAAGATAVTVANIISSTGVNGTGVFSGAKFSAVMSPVEAEAASVYLDGSSYDPDGGNTPLDLTP